MRIALAQVDSRPGDVDANVEQAEEVLDDAVRQAPDLVVFPELQLSGYSVGGADRDPSLRPGDDRLQRLADRSGKAGVHLGFAESGTSGLHTYNSAAYYEDGNLVHVHRKLYLPTYAAFEERKHFTPGQALRGYPVQGRYPVATLICNDAWQPPLAFLATQDGANVLLVPAASAQSNSLERYDAMEYWYDLTRFYGRMFQLYVVFVNRVGCEGELRFWGDSHVVDPWGDVVAAAAEGTEDLLTVDIDLDEVRRRRRDMPLGKEARLGLLRREIERLLDEGGDL